jgi:hypothetical protein
VIRNCDGTATGLASQAVIQRYRSFCVFHSEINDSERAAGPNLAAGRYRGAGEEVGMVVCDLFPS